MSLRSVSQPNLGKPAATQRLGNPRLAPIRSSRSRSRRRSRPTSVEPRYLPGRSRLLETDHSLEDVSFRFPEEVDGQLSAATGRPSLDTIELASATVAKSLPPNKLAPFGDSSMSGITAIQNDRSEPYLHALRTMPSGAVDPGASQPSRRDTQFRGVFKPADTVRTFDEVLGRLTGQPLEAPKKGAAPKKVASTTQETEPQQMAAHGGEESVPAGRSAAAIRARLAMKIDDVRYDDARFRDLGASVRKCQKERLDAMISHRKGTGRDFVALNLRPLSPQKKMEAIAMRAAVEREKSIHIQNKKAIIDMELRARAELQANRREVKKQREAAQRRASELRQMQSQHLVVVALASRAMALVNIIKGYRAVDDEVKTKTRAASMIQTCFRAFKWRKDTMHVREARHAAARRVQGPVRSLLFRRRLQKRKAAAGKIIFALECISKTGTFPTLVRGFRFKIAQIQRAWRRFKTMQKAQVVVVSIWLISLRSKTIKRRKQLEQELKDHKENKAKAKAGGRKQVDTVRLGLEETINSLPKYEDKPPSMEVLQTVVLDWLKRRKRKKQKALQAYQIARKEYDEQMAALETILAARQAMGASEREDMPIKPIMPFFILFPSTEEGPEVLFEAQSLTKRTKKSKP